MSTSAIRRKTKASRDQNDNARWGYAVSAFSMKLHKKLIKDVAAGILPKSVLRTTMMITGKKPKTPKNPAPSMLGKLKNIITGEK